MEWLINRRRMMCHESVPPVYLTFEDTEFWRLTCINYGDYNETVITDNGDNTVNITTTFKSVIVSPTNQRTVTLKKTFIISEETNVDNSEGTYVAGTTKEPIGITQRQCDAIKQLGYHSGGYGIVNVYTNNSLITSANDFAKFRNMTEICGNWNAGLYGGPRYCSNLETAEIPESLRIIGEGAFYNCFALKHLDFKNVTQLNRQCFGNTSLQEAVFNEGFTSLNAGSSASGAFYGVRTLTYVDLPSTIVGIGNDNFRLSSPILVCRATTPPTLGAYNDGPTTIYVPQASLEAYAASPDWSSQASKLRAIEGTWYETHRELEPTT